MSASKTFNSNDTTGFYIPPSLDYMKYAGIHIDEDGKLQDTLGILDSLKNHGGPRDKSIFDDGELLRLREFGSAACVEYKTENVPIEVFKEVEMFASASVPLSDECC